MGLLTARVIEAFVPAMLTAFPYPYNPFMIVTNLVRPVASSSLFGVCSHLRHHICVRDRIPRALPARLQSGSEASGCIDRIRHFRRLVYDHTSRTSIITDPRRRGVE